MARTLGGLAAGLALLFVVIATALPVDSPWRAPKDPLMVADAPLMQAIVPLMFLLFLVPGIIAGTIPSHRDVIQGMSKSMAR